MKDDDRARCERLAYASKKGRLTLTDDDIGFMTKMWVNYPVEYKAIQKAAHDSVHAELNPLFSGVSHA